MSDRLAVTRVVSTRELVTAPRPLSAYFLKIEAEMVAEMARTAHMHGKRFVEWPRFSVVQDDNVWARVIRYVAEVEAE